jgi:hypothetical protein
MTVVTQPLRPGIILLQVNGLIFLSLALAFLLPVFALIPLVVLFRKQLEFKWVVPSLLVWLAATFILNKPLFLYFLMFNVVLSLAIYYFYNLKSDWNGLIVSLTVYAALQVCIILVYQKVVRREVLEPVLKMIGQLPWDEMTKDQAVALITRYPVALLYTFIMTVSFFTVFVSGFFNTQFGARARLMRQLVTLKLNFHFLWVLIAVWAAVAVSLLIKNEPMKVIAANAAAIVSFFYFMQGLLVSSIFISNLKIPVIIKFFIVGLVLILLNRIQMVLVFILCSLGVFDEWVGFRNIKFEQPDGGNEE